MLQFYTILTYTNIGKRPKQEDSFYTSENLLIVCDGIGGLGKGDVASQFICKTLSKNLNRDLPEDIQCTPAFINKAVLKAREALTLEAKRLKIPKMGATLTFVFICNNQVFAGHLDRTNILIHQKRSKLSHNI